MRTIETTLPMQTVQAWAMLIGSALLFLVGNARGESLAAIRLTPVAGLPLVYLGLVTGTGAFLIYFTRSSVVQRNREMTSDSAP